MAAAAQKATTRKRTPRKVFDPGNSNHWHELPSKGQLFTLAIAAYNGEKFPGSEIFGSRDEAKKIIAAIKGEES